MIFSAVAFSKMAMHAIKYPHSVCCGLLLSSGANGEQHEGNQEIIVDAIPISHISNYLTPHIEVAFTVVNAYAREQGMVVSGYYQTSSVNECNQPDIFSQRVAEKIQEAYPTALICYINTDTDSQFSLDIYRCGDGKWRRSDVDKMSFETDPEVLAENIIYSKEKLYRQIVDFDEHFDDISLEWTNLRVAQRVKHLVASIC